MSLESDLFAALGTITSIAKTNGSKAVYPVMFPQPARSAPEWPAIRYVFVSSVPVQDLCGDGDDDTSDTRIQIDAVDRTYEGARQLRLDVMAVMRSFVWGARLEFDSDEYDDATKTFRCVLDYIVNPSSGAGSP